MPNIIRTGGKPVIRRSDGKEMEPSLKLRTETKQDGTSVLNGPVCECRFGPVCEQILVVLTYFYNFAV